MFRQSERRCSAKLVVDMAPPLSKWRAARRSSRSRASTWRSAYAPLPSKRACGVAELAVKGEYMAVGMRAATIKEACGVAKLTVEGESMRSTCAPLPSKRACGVAEFAIKGETMAVGMRAATIKEACGVAELAVKGESMAFGMRAASI